VDVRPLPATEQMGRLLVGWDGSGPSVAALRWALDRAERTSEPVTALHVVEQGAVDLSDSGFARIVADAAVSHPSLFLSTALVAGFVVDALVRSADQPGDLLVVGTHRTGAPHTSGPVSRSVEIAAALGTRLVVVPDVDIRLRHGVVVGVQNDDEAVWLGVVAGAEADRCGSEVLAIHAVGTSTSLRERRGEDVALLGRARAAAAAPGRTVSSRSVDREPLEALLECSRNAALLVMGTSAPTAGPRALSSAVRDVLLDVNAPTLIVPGPPPALPEIGNAR
jgi:nucleotide-binding universal stress UspA family protein